MVFSNSRFIKHSAWKCSKYFEGFKVDREVGAKLGRGAPMGMVVLVLCVCYMGSKID